MSETKPVRILYMEDDPGLALLFKKKLEKIGYKVDLAGDGQEGLTMYERGSYDLVAIDQIMPVYEGLEVINRLAAKGTLPPIVMITGYGNEQIAVKAMKLGVQDYIVKDGEGWYLELIPSVLERILKHEQLEAEKKRAEEALRASEEKFRGLVTMAPDGIFLTDTQGVILELNEALARMHGYTRDEMLGKGFLEFIPRPEQRAVVAQVFNTIRKVGSLPPQDIYITTRTGEQIPAELTVAALQDDKTVTRFIAVVRNITERQRTEEQRTAYLRYLENMERIHHVVKNTTDIDQMLHKVIETILSIFNCEMAGLWYPCDPQAPTWQMAVQYCRPPYTSPIPPGQDIPMTPPVASLLQTALNSRDPLRQSQASLYLQDMASKCNIRSQMGMAIHPQVGKPWLLTIFQSSSEREWTDEEERLFCSIGHRLAETLTSMLLLKNLQESEERYRMLVETSSDLIFQGDTHGHFIFVNEAFVKTLGYSAEELKGKNGFELIHPEDSPLVRMELRKAVGGQNVNNVELRFQAKNSNWVYLLLNASPRFDHNGEVAGITGTAKDITERKLAEQRIFRRNRELGMLNKVIAASAANLSPQDILQVAVQELAHAFELPQVSAIMFDHTKEQAIVMADYHLENQLPLPHQIYPLADIPGIKSILEQIQPAIIYCNEIDQISAAFKEDFARREITSLLSLPLAVEKQVVGSINLYFSPTTPVLTQEKIDLAQSVAGETAGALSRAWLNEEHQRLREQYRQSQKMEAVGQLAAGIAHDFNNLLTGINGFAELLQRKIKSDDPNRKYLDNILKSGQKAAKLVGQLLTFSRNQVVKPQVLNLNTMITEMEKILQRTLGESIQQIFIPGSNLWPIEIDFTQAEQILLNLAANARDAMPDGGKLTIATFNAVLDDHTATRLGLPAGDYVRMSVTDTGSGMSESVQSHIFEPFFTTKDIDKGTGLGLSAVFGIVKQNDGAIEVQSRQGQGSTFNIYLPRTDEKSHSTNLAEDASNLPVGQETILLVEDNKEIRALASTVLKERGYTLLEAQDGWEALQISNHYQHPINLLLTDVVMPRMSGTALAKKLKQARPALRMLFISGYPDEAILQHGFPDTDADFLSKPFSPSVLAQKVRSTLDK